MRTTTSLLALLLAGCDCRGARGPGDGAVDAAVDSATDLDAGDGGHDAEAAPDASSPDPLPCDTSFEDPSCGREEPYCCLSSQMELAHYECHPEPTMPGKEEGPVSCWEYPTEPGALPGTGCDGANPCPVDHPWCCLARGRQYCSVEVLYGWSCVDLSGEPAGQTGEEREDLIRRCAEEESCPDDYPYCCDDLFCATGPLHGWSCAAR